MIGTTPKQQRCLEFIESFIAEHRFSPSYREIRDGLGFKSTTQVHALVNSLKERGYVSFLPRKSRSISLVERSEAS